MYILIIALCVLTLTAGQILLCLFSKRMPVKLIPVYFIALAIVIGEQLMKGVFSGAVGGEVAAAFLGFFILFGAGCAIAADILVWVAFAVVNNVKKKKAKERARQLAYEAMLERRKQAENAE